MSRDPKTPPQKKQRKAWSEPQLERLGTLGDIAGPPVPFAQSAGNKFS